MSYKNLTVEHDGHIAIVTFNRPDKANALSYEHLAEIENVAHSFRDEAETRVVIFTGNGKHFCGGADLTDAGEQYKGPMVLRRRRKRMGERAINAIVDIDQITIAAWHGAAMGGGACIATACDFRIGAEGCFMQYPEIDIGVNLQWKSLPLITHLVGPARAKRLVAGGERIHAETLLTWGILDELVSRDELTSAAQRLARVYVNKPPIAVQMIKRSVNTIMGALDQCIMHMDSDQTMLASTSTDQKEALRAYLAKTDPTFTGN